MGTKRYRKRLPEHARPPSADVELASSAADPEHQDSRVRAPARRCRSRADLIPQYEVAHKHERSGNHFHGLRWPFLFLNLLGLNCRFEASSNTPSPRNPSLPDVHGNPSPSRSPRVYQYRPDGALSGSPTVVCRPTFSSHPETANVSKLSVVLFSTSFAPAGLDHESHVFKLSLRPSHAHRRVYLDDYSSPPPRASSGARIGPKPKHIRCSYA